MPELAERLGRAPVAASVQMTIKARELRAAHGLIVYSASWFNLPLGEAGARTPKGAEAPINQTIW